MARKSTNIDSTDVVELLSFGYNMPEIAKQLNVNVRTLEARTQRLRDKVNAVSNTHLVAIYLRKKLIQ